MESPLTARSPTAHTRSLEIDVQVALRVDDFHWVSWREGASPDPPRESQGRFLARRDHPLAHLFREAAPPSMPLAPQPYRHVPRYSLDAALALAACDRVGLFLDGGVTLRRDPDGAWSLELPGDVIQRDPSLACLLARAALRCGERRAHYRQQLQ